MTVDRTHKLAPLVVAPSSTLFLIDRPTWPAPPLLTASPLTAAATATIATIATIIVVFAPALTLTTMIISSSISLVFAIFPTLPPPASPLPRPTSPRPAFCSFLATRGGELQIMFNIMRPTPWYGSE